MFPGPAERSNSIPKKRLDAALLFYGLSNRPSASCQQEPILFPVQQVHRCVSLNQVEHKSRFSSSVIFFFFSLRREILQPRDMVTIPSDDSTYMHFCGQFCLSVFRHKKKTAPDKIPDRWADKRLERQPENPPQKPAERQPEKPLCSVCKVTNKVRAKTQMVTEPSRVLCMFTCSPSSPGVWDWDDPCSRLSMKSPIKVVCTDSVAMLVSSRGVRCGS